MKTKKYIFRLERSLNFSFSVYGALAGVILISSIINSCSRHKEDTIKLRPKTEKAVSK